MKKKSHDILYKPDFLLEDENGCQFYVDVKGMETDVFKLKKKLWRKFVNKELRIVIKKGMQFLDKEIINGIQ